ncbi:Alpha-tocopherol transfer protein-like [Orchesella cincta]|uniref:Alpha-tocopherol transfer protein-like n=1 Tax=Orchesella cincta TaxID=48709 RepID=A0A1D2N6P3_ORCCI|nr:Alpha-tocopherol transfer protein-like [Orchesella cincta]
MLILGDPSTEEGVKSLRKRAKEDEDIRGCGLDLSDEFLSSFVRGKGGDEKKALKTLQSYVSVRKGKYNDFFRHLLPSRCKYFQDLPKFEAFLKHRDDEGHVVGLFKLSAIDFSVVDIEDVFAAFVLAAEELLIHEDLTKNGLVAIIDCRGIGLQHVRAFTPSRIQFLFNIFIGTPSFDPLLKVFKMFAPKKIRERIFLHGRDDTSLHKIVPSSILPDWLGGELAPEDCYDYELEEDIYAQEDHFRKIAMKW